MRSLLAFFCIAGLLVGPTVFARGTSTDGGGSAAICFQAPADAQKVRDSRGYINSQLWAEIKEQITIIASLDHIEEISIGMTPADPHMDSTSIPSGIREWISKSRTIELDRDKVILKNAVLFHLSQMTFKSIDGPVKQIQDSGWLDNARRQIPSNCAIVTVAYQKDVERLTEVEVDSRIFNHPKQSDSSRRALAVHEVLYRMARRELGHLDSNWIRTKTALLVTDGL